MTNQWRDDARFPGVRIHASSYVDEPVAIGADTVIWHFCHVLGGVTIGKRCSIGQNVMIGPNVTVGDGCKIQNNVSLYEGLVLEDEVFCGPSCVFTNVLNPRSFVSRKAEFRKTIVRRGATTTCGSPHPLDPRGSPGWGIERRGEVPRLAIHLAVPELDQD